MYVLMSLHFSDIFPPGDLATIKAVYELNLLPPESSKIDIIEYMRRFSPYQSAATYIFVALLYRKKKTDSRIIFRRTNNFSSFKDQTTEKMTQFKYLIFILLFTVSCTSGNKQKTANKNVQVELKTSMGDILLELSNETPLHRDNFVKLVNKGYFNGMLFHRVINDFGIQSGDPDSKNAKPGEALGNGGPGYTISAEIKPDLFNKRGAILAARDNNPERASSGSQFFIVQGKIQTNSTLARSEERINQWLTENAFVNDPANRAIHDSLQNAILAENEEEVMK